jgi:hypothetical protein
MFNKTIRYYAYAATTDKTRIGLLLVIRENGRQTSQSWTGRYWPNTRAGSDAAARRCGTLNDGLVRA